MKKFVLTLTALALMANALAQAPFRIDTSYQTYQHFDYDAWVSEDSVMHSKAIFNLMRMGDIDLLQYNYTDDPKGTRVVGLFAVFTIFHEETHPMIPPEYLLLYDDSDSAGVFVSKAQAPWEESELAELPLFHWSQYPGVCGEQHWPLDDDSSSLVRQFEYYFDSAITVYDSFYVGCTNRFFMGETPTGSPYDFNRAASYMEFGPIEVTGANCPLPHILQMYYNFSNPMDGWRHFDNHRFLLVMPIIEVYDTVITGPSGCPKTEGAFVRGNYSDTVTVQWDSDSLHPAHLVSWGPAGTWPNDGNIDTVWGDNKWVFTDTAYQDDYMVAYVSTLCTDWDSVRHSVWSSALSWRLHNWNMGGHDDDVGIPDDRSDLARFTHVMPNPASHAAMVASSFRIEKVEAYNAAGTKVLDQAVGTLNATLDLDGWPQGAYVLLVRTAAGTTAKRLVVQ